MPLNLLVINNLASGFQDGLIYDYLRQLAEDGDAITLRHSDGSTAIESLVEDARAFDAVVASGGDGTIAAVAYALAYSGVPILPFPSGTGNLLTSNLRQPPEPHGLARITKEMLTLTFDMGEIEAKGQKFGFNVMAGAGFDATIMQDAKPAKKTLGAMAYLSAAFSNLLPQRSKMTLTIDGEKINSEGLGALVVNFPRIQFEIPLTPDSNPRDGLFEVAILKAHNAPGLIPAFVAGIMDRDGEHPSRSDSVEILRGRTIEVAANPSFPGQFDGETPGLTTPFTLRVKEGAARYILSEEAYDLFV